MKKLENKKFLTLIAVSLLAASSIAANAQGSFVARSDNQAAGLQTSTFETSDPDASSNATIVSERVSNNFTKRFSGATDAVWTKTDEGFVARFTSNGIQNWAYFTERGVCESQVSYYSEKELSPAVRNLVKRTYNDFNISSVKEVRHNNTTAYLITIADATTWKVIRVVNGETDVMEEYVKG